MSPEDRIERYVLQRELGRGGMGSVWQAHDPQLDRCVAVKLMNVIDRADAGLRKRFEREAQAIARMKNPHVVQVHDYGVTRGEAPYIIMELLEGEDLAARLRRTKTVEPAALAPILSQMAKALDAAHQIGIIHRDLKPANVFLTRQDGETVVKIVDFGVATVREGWVESQSAPADGSQLIGTPHYMSPEQTRGRSIDYRADLWSFAVIAYEALTGRVPFKAMEISALLMQICMDAPEPPSALVAALDTEFDQFFIRALAKEPTQRFSSARELAAAFTELIAHRVERKPTKILVVDDEPDLLLLIEHCMHEQIEQRRYEIIFATNGYEALARLEEHPDIDIALTDINMPGMDGLTLLRKINEVAASVKSIIISAYGDMENIRRAMNYGAFDFLIKPIDFDDLETTIEKAAYEVRETRRAMRSIEENEALRMLVDTAVMERLVPLLRIPTAMTGEAYVASAAFIRVDLAGHNRQAQGAQHHIEALNHHFDAIVAILDSHGGVTVRFFGDAVLAVFRGSDHLVRTIRACGEIHGKLSEQTSNHIGAGIAHIGIASGHITAGSTGAPSKHRFEYSAFGEVVVTARKLEAAAKGGQTLIIASQENEVLAAFKNSTTAAVIECEPNDTSIIDNRDRPMPTQVVTCMDQAVFPISTNSTWSMSGATGRSARRSSQTATIGSGVDSIDGSGHRLRYCTGSFHPVESGISESVISESGIGEKTHRNPKE